jgi:hypothetical protein
MQVIDEECSCSFDSKQYSRKCIWRLRQTTRDISY